MSILHRFRQFNWKGITEMEMIQIERRLYRKE